MSRLTGLAALGRRRDHRTGIYAVEYILSSRVYVGSTGEGFSTRWANHQSLLIHGKHPCAQLQYDWILSGPGWFKFLVLEESPRKSLVASREQAWIDRFAGEGWYLYNTAPARDHNIRTFIPPGAFHKLVDKHGIHTIRQLRELTGLSPQQCWNLWHGKVGVGRGTAKKLHESCDIPYEELIQLPSVSKPSPRKPNEDAPREDASDDR